MDPPSRRAVPGRCVAAVLVPASVAGALGSSFPVMSGKSFLARPDSPSGRILTQLAVFENGKSRRATLDPSPFTLCYRDGSGGRGPLRAGRGVPGPGLQAPG